ncbi:MAG TPA: IS3 family transposase [Thiohalobacter sp.]|nr:IS3 family transposase [Thiohalobacter sp.]
MAAVLELSSHRRTIWSISHIQAGSGSGVRSKNERLLSRIHQVHLASRENYGERKTWKVLRAEGETCGRHRVARLRRLNGLIAKRTRRFRQAYAARNNLPPAPNLLARDFTATGPDRVWVSDITFVPTRRGWLYLAVMVDLFSRRVVGWSMNHRADQHLTADALQMALRQRQPLPGLIHHSDQGIQYAAASYRELLHAHGIVQSMSRKGNCLDNAVAESFFSNMKNELIHHTLYEDREQARSAIFEYMEMFYNRQRIHETLGYISPAEYERLMDVA